MRIARFALLLLGILFLLGVGGVYWLFFAPLVVGTPTDTFTLKIKPGMSFDSVVTMMQEDKLIRDKTRLDFAADLLGSKNKIKAGKYAIVGGLSTYRLLDCLVQGKVAREWVTIAEGKQARQIASVLQSRIEIDSTRFMQLVYDPQFAHKMEIEASSLEGFLYPETYELYWGMKPEDVIQMMVRQFKKQFTEELQARARESGFTVLQTVTLASIIEGEAVVDLEREIISAVYYNRLKRRMLLQADPTIQYLVPDGPRRLLKRDLEIDSPYNTYKYTGLPPGPVNNPGVASMRASLYPAEVDYLYFVANGDGSHTFSRTYDEHVKAKARFDQYRREVKNKMRREGDRGENKISG